MNELEEWQKEHALEAMTLLRMVAVHFRHPDLGGLSEEQLAAIDQWYSSANSVASVRLNYWGLV